MPLKETFNLNWILPKLSQNASVHRLNLFKLSSLRTDTLSLVALMWVSSVFWALLSMPRSLQSPLYTVPMDSRPRGPHSDMCFGGFTPHIYSPSEVIFPSRNPYEKQPSKQAFEGTVTLSSILFPVRRGTQQAAEEWELTEKKKRMSRFSFWQLKISVAFLQIN